jgi:hypothetical protein
MGESTIKIFFSLHQKVNAFILFRLMRRGISLPWLDAPKAQQGMADMPQLCDVA